MHGYGWFCIVLVVLVCLVLVVCLPLLRCIISCVGVGVVGSGAVDVVYVVTCIDGVGIVRDGCVVCCVFAVGVCVFCCVVVFFFFSIVLVTVLVWVRVVALIVHAQRWIVDSFFLVCCHR